MDLKFDITDLRLLRTQALEDYKQLSSRSRLRGGSNAQLDEGDLIAISYYKAAITLLRQRGLLNDAPMPETYYPDSECDDEGFQIENGKTVKVKVPK